MIKLTPYIFAFTLFISAMLVFSVQPMLGKMMLPHVGGAPSGWAVTMFFFQTCLLFGYGLAYLFSKLPPFFNILAILGVFLPATLFLPIAYHSGIADSVSPWAVFVQLTASTAVPFLALSTLAPGLQRIFSYSNHKTASDPYYLYAASNVGSFVGLLAYPFILEPLIGLQTQSHIWMIAFSLLFFSVLFCGFVIFNNNRTLISFKFIKPKADNEITEPITWARRFKWLLLAAIPSSLMIGTTTEITTDLASAPMIWVLPLSLYLLTNIMAFAKRHTIDTNLFSTLHILSTVIIAAILLIEFFQTPLNDQTIIIGLIYIVTFTITAYLLHATLANDRPKTKNLTEFYLFMALGGALGGSFNAFIAPAILHDVYEFQYVFVFSLLLNPTIRQSLSSSLNKASLAIVILITAITIILVFYGSAKILFGLLVFLLIILSVNTKALFATLCGLLLVVSFSSSGVEKATYTDRNFFGVVKVAEDSLRKGSDKKVRILYHGTTIHGFEPLDPEHAHKPYSYYGAKGPVGDIMRIKNPKNIVVLGLGVGQIACYKQPDRHFTFYEIDPHVVKVAKEQFSLLEKCGHKDIIVGDARLELIKDKNKYDLIVADAFSSDSVPAHLITSEAIALYKSKLEKNGVILINISNRHLDLTTPIAATAHHNDISFRTKYHSPQEDDGYHFASEWIVLTNHEKTIEKLDKKGWKSIKTDIKPWTDDYSNLMSTLRILNPKKYKEKAEQYKKEHNIE